MKKPSITTISLMLFGLTIVTYLLKYLMNLILANSLSAEIYGDLSVALRVLGIVATVALLGTGTSSKRFLAKYLQYNDTNLVSDFMNWNTRLVMRSYLSCVVLAVLSGALMTHLHIFGIKNISSYHLAVYMLWIAPLSATAILLGSYLQCGDRPIVSYLFPDTLRYLLFVVLFSLAFLAFDIAPSNIVIAAILFSTLMATVISQLAYIYVRAPFLFQYFRTFAAPHDKEKEKEWLKVSVLLITNQIFFLVLSALDLIIIEIVGAEAEVGYYSAVLTIINILWLLPTGPLRLVNPTISTLIGSDQGRKELQRSLNRAFSINLISCSLTAILITLFSGRLLAHFGPAYVQAQTALLIALCAPLIAMLSRGAISLLAYSEKQKALLKITLAEFAVLLVLGLILTHFYGMPGMAVATVASVVTKALAVMVTVKRNFRLKPLGII